MSLSEAATAFQRGLNKGLPVDPAIAAGRSVGLAGPLLLEELLCNPRLGQFPASPVQRALMRAADGLPVDLPPDRMRFHFGCEQLPQKKPRVVIVRTGVRAAKSLIAAMALAQGSLTCRFRRPPEADEIAAPDGLVGVRPGELVRTLIVAPKLKLSRAPLHHLKTTLQNSKALAPLLTKPQIETCTMKRSDGNEVLVEMVAADSGGGNLRSTWLASVLFDEADFHDDEGAAVNLADNFRAVTTRVLPGGQIWVVSSPWTDSGPFHEMFTKAFGNPDGHTLAFHSDTRSMNPTLSREDEEAERRKNPENAAREYDAIPIPAGTARFFPDDAITKSVNPRRDLTLPPKPGVLHFSGADWGLTKNSSAQAIARPEEGKAVLVFTDELRPTKEASVSPGLTVPRFLRQGMEYGCRTVRGDHYLAPLRREEREKYLETLDGQKNHVPEFEPFDPNREAQVELFTELRRGMLAGEVELPNDPRLIAQLKGTTVAHLPGGATKIVLPKHGHAHGDVLFAAALALVACMESLVKREAPPLPGAGEWWRGASARGFR